MVATPPIEPIVINFEEGLQRLLVAIVKKKLGYHRENNSTCSYRYEDGHVCAIGAMITPEQYTHEIEGETVDSLVFDNQIKFTKKSHGKLAKEIQRMHDSACRTAGTDVTKHNIKKFEARVLQLSKKVKG